MNCVARNWSGMFMLNIGYSRDVLRYSGSGMGTSDLKLLAALHILLLNFVDELRRAKLVRDVHVEHRILARRVAVQRIGHGHIDHEARAGGLVALPFVPARQLKALPVIAKRDAMARHVMPGPMAHFRSPGESGRVRAAFGRFS